MAASRVLVRRHSGEMKKAAWSTFTPGIIQDNFSSSVYGVGPKNVTGSGCRWDYLNETCFVSMCSGHVGLAAGFWRRLRPVASTSRQGLVPRWGTPPHVWPPSRIWTVHWLGRIFGNRVKSFLGRILGLWMGGGVSGSADFLCVLEPVSLSGVPGLGFKWVG